MTRARPTRWAAPLLVVVALGSGWVTPTAASSQADDEDAVDVGLVEQTPWVGGDETFRVTVQIDDPPEGAEVQLVVRSRVRSRVEFGQSTTGDRLRAVLHSGTPQPVAELAAGPDPTVSLDLPLADATYLRTEGVYPVEVRILDEGERVGRLITHLVLEPAPDEERPLFAAALVVDVAAPPALRPDGSSELEADALEQLDRTAALLAEQPDVPLTIAAVPETVDALGTSTEPRATAALDALRSAVDGRQVLGMPYVRSETSALVDAGLGDVLDESIEQGTDLLADQLGVTPDDRTWLAEASLSPSTVAALGARGRDRVVVAESQIERPADEPVTITRSFALSSTGAEPRAVVADAVLAFRMLESDDGVLQGHQLLAELAVLALDDAEADRGAVLHAPPGATVSPVATETLLGGLAEPNLLVEPVTLDQLFGQIEQADADDGPVALIPQPAAPLDRLAPRLTAARQLLASYAGMVGPLSPRAEPFLQRLLTSTSSDLEGDERLAYPDAVRRDLRRETGRIELPDSRTITLTARSGVIPVTVRNDAGYPVTVTIQLDSQRLEFPGGRAIELTLEDELTRRDIAVRTRGSGSFPVRIEVTSPDGAVELASSRVIVRSTTVSGVGLVLSVGALGFLLVWWARHWRDGRRDRRLIPPT